MDLSRRFVHCEDVIEQRSGEDLVLFHLESGHYYSLNELGARVWELCDSTRPLAEIVDLLETEYDVSREKLLNDVGMLVKGLLENNLLEAGVPHETTK